MNPHDRQALFIKVWQGLESRARRHGWHEVDRALQAGGRPVFPDWEGDLDSYLITTLNGVSDRDLERLYDVLYPATPTPLIPDIESSSVWEPGWYRLFLSHTHKFAGAMGSLKEDLAE